jgi:hypothetical protein
MNATPGNELALTSSVDEMCAARDAAMAGITKAASAIQDGYRLASEANEHARRAHNGAQFHISDEKSRKDYNALFGSGFDTAASVDAYRRDLDSAVWTNIIDRLGISDLMDKTAKEEMRAELLANVPEVSRENVFATIENLMGDRELIFQRGLAVAFSRLDKRFRSHDGFKIGSRIILTRVFDDWGSWNYHADHRSTFVDVERVFAVLDGENPNPTGLVSALNASRAKHHGPHQSECEGTYFKIRTFKNGNAYLWFTRDGLVKKANKILADYYGAVLPDAVEKDAAEHKLKNRTNLPCKDLQFYPTPDAVTDVILRYACLGNATRILEPSAGAGDMARRIVEKTGCTVDAIEIDAGRADRINPARDPRVNVTCANFLKVPARPEYCRVIMNPPFYGTHWMDHVLHAFDFLTPGGTLYAVLPASAEFGESAKHEAFRKWLKENTSTWNGHSFRALPAESFAKSGTRISTVILEINKPR